MNRINAIILAVLFIIVISMTGYSLYTGDSGLVPYIQMVLGLLLVTLGITEVKENRKRSGIFYFIIALLSIAAGILKLIG